MEVVRIKSKYCTNNKVQIMFSNAPNQIICSRDGYLYLRDGEITIHRYLEDEQRKKMPYRKHPSSTKHATHLLKFNQLYAKFTQYREMVPAFQMEGMYYTLSFLYAKKAKGGAIFTEMMLADFTQGEDDIRIMTKEQVEGFLYDISNVRGKYICDLSRHLVYAKSDLEEICIKKPFLDLSEQGILQRFNAMNQPIPYVSYHNEGKKIKNTEGRKVENIGEVPEFCLTDHFFGSTKPILLVVKERGITAYRFGVTFIGPNCYRVKKNRIDIVPNLFRIMEAAPDATYLTDPSF